MTNTADESDADPQSEPSETQDAPAAAAGDDLYYGEIDSSRVWNQILDQCKDAGVPVVLVLYCNDRQRQPADARTLAGEFPGVAFVVANSFTVQHREIERLDRGEPAINGLLIPIMEQQGGAHVFIYQGATRVGEADAPTLAQFRDLVASHSS